MVPKSKPSEEETQTQRQEVMSLDKWEGCQEGHLATSKHVDPSFVVIFSEGSIYLPQEFVVTKAQLKGSVRQLIAKQPEIV